MFKATWALMAAGVMLCAPAGAQPKTQYLPRIEAALPPKTDVTSIRIIKIPASPPERNHVILGRFAALGESQNSFEALLDLATAKAAELGADFIVLAEPEEGTRHYYDGPAASRVVPRRRDSLGLSISSAPLLKAIFGVYTKATMGLQYHDMRQTWGRAVVKGFRPGSKAPDAGVLIGDEVIEVDGIGFRDDRISLLALAAKPGQFVKLLLKRQEKELRLEVQLIPND